MAATGRTALGLGRLAKRTQGKGVGSNAPKVNTFKLRCQGQVSSGQIPHKVPIAVNYVLVAGEDWKETFNADGQHDLAASGATTTTAISQYAAFRSTASNDEPNFVWNFPLDVQYCSTNPHGWPRLVVVLYDRDVLIKGYGSCLLPTTPGQHTKYVRMFVPASSSDIQEVLSDVRKLPPEFQDMNFPAKVSAGASWRGWDGVGWGGVRWGGSRGGDGCARTDQRETQQQGPHREVTRTESSGVVKITLEIAIAGMEALGYDN